MRIHEMDKGRSPDQWFVVVSLTLALTATALYFYTPAIEESRPEIYPVGSELPGPLAESGAGAQLVLGLRSDCQYCVASSSFYSKLIEHCRRSGVRVRVVTLESPGAVRAALLASLDPDVDVRQVPELDFRGTPAIVLADGLNVVVASWLGQLSPALEQRVLNDVSTLARAVSLNNGPAR